MSTTLCCTCAYFCFFEEVAASLLLAAAGAGPRAQGSRALLWPKCRAQEPLFKLDFKVCLLRNQMHYVKGLQAGGHQ